jgi:hypothetical protein
MSGKSLIDRLRAWFGEEHPAPPARPTPSPWSTPPVAPPPAPTIDEDDARIPDASRQKLRSVRALIADLEKRGGNEGLGSTLLIDLRQMREVHLPRLIQSYIDIPPAHRSEIFRKTGRSASYVLNDGLDTMAERLQAMSRSLAQGNLDAFTDNLRFIDSRYGDGSPLD